MERDNPKYRMVLDPKMIEFLSNYVPGIKTIMNMDDLKEIRLTDMQIGVNDMMFFLYVEGKEGVYDTIKGALVTSGLTREDNILNIDTFNKGTVNEYDHLVIKLNNDRIKIFMDVYKPVHTLEKVLVHT